MRYFLLVALLLPVNACASIGHEKVAGWPELKVVEHHVSSAAMRERCGRYALLPFACAEFDLKAMRCDIWYGPSPSPAVVAHERMHCAGYDHVGETYMRDHLARFKGER